MQAEVCKVLANPKRLEIMCILECGELCVSDIVKKTGIAKANVSQHLSLMKDSGIVTARREAQSMFYSLTNPKVMQACKLMKEVLVENIERKNKLVS